jgi:hypothetical protein
MLIERDAAILIERGGQHQESGSRSLPRISLRFALRTTRSPLPRLVFIGVLVDPIPQPTNCHSERKGEAQASDLCDLHRYNPDVTQSHAYPHPLPALLAMPAPLPTNATFFAHVVHGPPSRHSMAAPTPAAPFETAESLAAAEAHATEHGVKEPRARPAAADAVPVLMISACRFTLCGRAPRRGGV